MGLWVPLFLVLATTSRTTEALFRAVPAWKVDRTGKITVHQESCGTIGVFVRAGNFARITVKADDLNGCSIDDFRISDSLVRASGNSDACPKVSKTLDERTSKQIGPICSTSQRFWYPIASSCTTGGATFTYTMETKILNDEDDSCSPFADEEDFDILLDEDTSRKITTGIIVVAVVFPILVIVGIILCCCFCACCPCYYKRNQAVVVTSTTDTMPQQEMVGYPFGKPV